MKRDDRLLGAFVLFVYATIFIARWIQRGVEQTAGRPAFFWMTLGAIAIAAAALWRHRDRIRWTWMLGVAALYAAGTWMLRRDPEEALHFVQYGIVGLLAYRSLRHRMRDPLVFIAAGLLGAWFGILDEMIQYLAPRRYFDFRDLLINVSAVALMQVALFAGWCPVERAGAVARSSVRRCADLLILVSATMLLCFLNTLERQTWIEARIGRRFDDLMVEYGFRHRLDERTAFVSRLSRSELADADAARADEVAKLLDAYPGTNGYKRFMVDVSPLDDAFAYETRIRLFRRDKYAGEAVALRNRPETARYAATIAWRENRIAEIAASNTLARSSYRLREDWRPILDRLADRESPYASPVSQHLFTRWTERQAIMLWLGLIFLGLVARWRARDR